MLSIFEINSYDKDDIIIVREERQARIKETKVMSYILCIIILYSQQLNYGQFWVLNRNLLYCFLKSMYGEHLNSSGTDSQIFVAEKLNVDVP